MNVRLHLVNCALLCAAVLGLLLSACAKETPAPPAATPAPSAQAVPAAPAETLAPPAATPAHPAVAPATPKIADAWYAARTTDLQSWLARYGGYSGDALTAKLAAMEIDPDKPMIALTFDDGPMEGVTDAIVDILASYDCRATFFIRGSRMKAAATPGLLQKILGEGNELGNHTWGHEILSKANGKVMLDTLQRTNDAVRESTGFTMHVMRPPGGYSSSAVRRMAGRLELAVVLWSQSGNVHEQDPAKIAENVQRQIVNGKELASGDIVLLHDTKPWMVEAVSIMVPQLLERGYQLVTVSELLNLSPRGLMYGEAYHKQVESGRRDERTSD